MMSAAPVELKIRPLAESRFIQGYPGIPPSGPKSLATIDGEVVVKVNQRGIRGKYLRVGLVQVEMVPKGNGIDNFYEAVVPGPIILWESGKRSKRLQEFSHFHFGFQRQYLPASSSVIRVRALFPFNISRLTSPAEAGIRYKLCAKLFTKTRGKRFSGQSTSRIYRAEEPIIIDKHEMHSTWPIYSKYRVRSATDLGCTLVATSNRSCYGPGDRVCVGATFSIDELEERGVLLRGFELSLDESAEFRSGVLSPPQMKSETVCRGKLQINRAVKSNAPQKVELACFIPSDRVTVSLWSRHIQVEHTITVKAILEDLPPIIISLPVVVTNWPRHLSARATKRIGLVPSLSLDKDAVLASRQSVTSNSDLAPIRQKSLAHGTSHDSMFTIIESDDTPSQHTSSLSSHGPHSSQEGNVTTRSSSIRSSKQTVVGPRRVSLASSALGSPPGRTASINSVHSRSSRRTRRGSRLVLVTPIDDDSSRRESQISAASPNVTRSPNTGRSQVLGAIAESVVEKPATPKIRLTIPESKSAEDLTTPHQETMRPTSSKRYSSSDSGHGEPSASPHRRNIEAEKVILESRRQQFVSSIAPLPRGEEDARPASFSGPSTIPLTSPVAVPQRATTLHHRVKPLPPSPLQVAKKSLVTVPIPLPPTPNYEFLHEDPARYSTRQSVVYTPHAEGSRPLPQTKRDTRASLATLATFVSDGSSIYRATLRALPSPMVAEKSTYSPVTQSPSRRPLPTPPDTPPAGDDRPLSVEEEKAMIHKQVDRWHSRQRPESGHVRPPSIRRPMTPRHTDANNWDEDVITLASAGDEPPLPYY